MARPPFLTSTLPADPPILRERPQNPARVVGSGYAVPAWSTFAADRC